MTPACTRAALVGAASLTALTLASPAAASWTVAQDYVPSGGAVAPSATPGALNAASGWSDAFGNVWGINASSQITPSGGAAGTSANTYDGEFELVRPAGEASQNQKAAVTFVYTASGPSLQLEGHVSGAGTTSKAALQVAINNSSLTLYYVSAGVQHSLGSINFTALTVGATYKLAASFVGVGSSTMITGTLYNASGGQIATDSVTTASGPQTAGPLALYQYQPSASAFWPLTELATYSYVPPVTIAITGQPITWSPLNWDYLQAANGDYGVGVDTMQATNNGAFLRFNAVNTSFVGLSLDLTPWASLSSPTFTVAWSIDDGPLQSTQYVYPSGTGQSAYTVYLASNLAVGTHTVEYRIVSANVNQGVRYSTTTGTSATNMLRVNGVVVDQGGSLAPFSGYAAPASVCGVFGDSITEGAYANPGFIGATPVDWGSYSYAVPLAAAMGCELGQVGFSGTGYDWVPTYSGAASFKTSYSAFSAGRPRPASGLAYAFDVLGTNDALNGVAAPTVQSDVRAILTGQRALYGPLAWLFVVTPPGGYVRSTLDAAVAAYKLANPLDGRVARIDVSDLVGTRGLTDAGASQQAQVEGLHPQVQTQAAFGAAVAVKAKAILSPGGGLIGFHSGFLH